ncbi:MAG: hypothetical protein EXS46_01460 [Candidatus Taylorbacteria bacterium]|nr:hypothetical protein [Candidatus Taylorbacteria bacterium]
MESSEKVDNNPSVNEVSDAFREKRLEIVGENPNLQVPTSAEGLKLPNNLSVDEVIDAKIAGLPDIKRLEEALQLNQGVGTLMESKIDRNTDNAETLELTETETMQELIVKISKLSEVSFESGKHPGKDVADTLQKNLAYIDNDDFGKLKSGQKAILIQSFVNSLKKIDERIANLKAVTIFEGYIEYLMSIKASEETVLKPANEEEKNKTEISLERRRGLNVGDEVMVLENGGLPVWKSPKKIIAFWEDGDGKVAARFEDDPIYPVDPGMRENHSVYVEYLTKVDSKSTPAPDAPPRPEASKVATEQPIQIISSPSVEIVQAVLEDPAGFDIGKAMDVPGFDSFIIESEKFGKNVDMEDKEAVRKLFEVFATKDAVANSVHALYAEAITKDIGLSLDGEGKKAVREHIERQAHNNPEALRVLGEKLKTNKELSDSVALLESQVAALKACLTQEAHDQAVQCLRARQRNFQVALDTNDFWTGAGWTHSVAALFGSEASAEKARIRSEVRETMARSSGLELISTFGQGLSSKELRTGLNLIEIQIAEEIKNFENTNLKMAEFEARRVEVCRKLDAGKIELFADSELKAKLVGLARAKVREKITVAVKSGSENTEKIDEAHTLFERAVQASLDKGVDYLDEPGTVDLGVLKQWLDTALDSGIERDVEKAISHSMALSSGRFGTLQKALDKLTAKEKLGSKSREEVRGLIVMKLEKELGVISKVKFDILTISGKKQAQESRQKAIHLEALVGEQKRAIVQEK